MELFAWCAAGRGASPLFRPRHRASRSCSPSRISLAAPGTNTIVSGYYSTDRSTIGLRMQERRRHRSVTVTAEKVFGIVLRDIRKERGLSQETLAFESDYHTTYIGQLERGLKSPSLRTILNLANALGTPGSEILRRVEASLGIVMTPKPRPSK